MLFLLRIVIVLWVLWASNIVNANCECGYRVSSTLYTELLETDFIHLTDITADTDWIPQNYTVSAEAARGPYGKNATLGNVIANPLENKYDSIGNGILGGDGGLQLWVRGGVPKNGLVPIAEISSARQDILYGSFRVGIKMVDVPGTCGALFWYFNDTQDIDIKSFSQGHNKTSNPMNLAMHSPAAKEEGFNAARPPTSDIYQLPFAPDGTFHEYRFDWSPDSVSFFADGQLLNLITQAIPTSPSHVILSHWNNGGPPATDALVTVSHFKGYFNSSAADRINDWTMRCTNISATNTICAEPEVQGPHEGNSSTFFFADQGNDTSGQTVQNADSEKQKVDRYLGWIIACLLTPLVLPLFFRTTAAV